MKKCYSIFPLFSFILLLMCVATLISGRSYRTSREESYIVNNDDGQSLNIMTANADELRSASLATYSGKDLGEIPDKKAAFKAASKVLDSVYGDCSETETPFEISFNENANAWIVNGTLPPFMLGGVGVVAIEKDTGEVLLLFHGK